VGITVAPRDTSIRLAQSYQLRGAGRDRAGNEIVVPITYVATGGAATVTAGGRVTGIAVGRTTVVASRNDWRDTVFVSVAAATNTQR
jgi:hypothetical protein